MGFIRLASESEVPEDGMISVRTKTESIVLAKVNGEIFAFEDRCTHDDGPLSCGNIHNGCVVCPRHGARFDMKTGEVKQLPATEDIETYEVRIIDGQVEVDI